MEELKSNSINMNTLKISIINAIKTLWSQKKRPDELTVLNFVKKISKQLLHIKILMKTYHY